MGLAAFGPDGTRLWNALTGEPVWLVETAGGYAYVQLRRRHFQAAFVSSISSPARYFARPEATCRHSSSATDCATLPVTVAAMELAFLWPSSRRSSFAVVRSSTELVSEYLERIASLIRR